MKRRDFIRELERAGCKLARHGSRHDLYRNPATGRQAPVPRHREISDSLCRLIRKQLGVQACVIVRLGDPGFVAIVVMRRYWSPGAAAGGDRQYLREE